GIGAAVAERLACDGFDIALTGWPPYDARMPWGRDCDPEDILALIGPKGVRTVVVKADLEQPEAAETLFDAAEEALGPVTVLVLCHCESVDSGILDTTVASFDRHFAVNTRATWLLIREYGLRFPPDRGAGRIVALTSDHTAGNLPYGASKGAC
ncbi:MAG: SDR family NAD(P)-dependent oxidoreductase, partial [Acidimicrobiales bacterium]